jgi:hypothetical protein
MRAVTSVPRVAIAVVAGLLMMAASRTAATGPAFPVLVGAGDIASCDSRGDEITARLLDGIPGTVFTTGDNAYEYGTDREFRECYHPSWGRHRGRTRPSVGNHDYGTPGAAGYFRYFGAAAGEPGRGYYSYSLGVWHVVVLNSNCRIVGCDADSEQVRWLRADLAAHPTRCTVAYYHHPRFGSGPHGGAAAMAAIWQVLYDAGVDLALAGHNHLYERFAPQDPAGQLDAARGIREITVGTGGRSHYQVRQLAANSEVRHTGMFGVLEVTLEPARYTWEFIPQPGKTFRDAGATACH